VCGEGISVEHLAFRCQGVCFRIVSSTCGVEDTGLSVWRLAIQGVWPRVGSSTCAVTPASCFCNLFEGFGFRVEGLGLRVQGLGLTVEGSGFRVEDLGFSV